MKIQRVKVADGKTDVLSCNYYIYPSEGRFVPCWKLSMMDKSVFGAVSVYSSMKLELWIYCLLMLGWI